MQRTILDSGPVVALFDASDKHHQASKNWLKTVKLPLVSNLAMVTEAIHMLDFHHQAAADCLAWLEQAVTLDRETVDDWPRIRDIFRRYHDLPADFCDASLVALAERINTRTVATFDTDFEIYRWKDRKPFELVGRGT